MNTQHNIKKALITATAVIMLGASLTACTQASNDTGGQASTVNSVVADDLIEMRVVYKAETEHGEVYPFEDAYVLVSQTMLDNYEELTAVGFVLVLNADKTKVEAMTLMDAQANPDVHIITGFLG